MIRAVVAFALSLLAGVALYPAVIGRLARWRAGQRVQTYGPTTHQVKSGTPTMGGVVFCALAVVMWLLLDRSRGGFLIVFAVVAGAAVGFLDDLANIRGRGDLGLVPRQKL